jgi:UDP-glucose 4-epimerase
VHFIVTGGAGFIGSHLTDALLAAHHTVTVIDDLSTGSLSNLPEHPDLKLVKRNILECIPEDFKSPIDGIAHLAATPSVALSWSDPLDTHHNNLSATLRLIQLVRALKIPRLVLASSAAVYGTDASSPIIETQPTQPISPYGLHKLVSEQYGQLFAPQFDFSFVALRLFNVFGERQLPSSEYSGVISVFTDAMKHQRPITVFGDGSQNRDFIYVKDVARAFVQALTNPLQTGHEISCNVGTGQSTSLNQLIHTLAHSFPSWRQDIHLAPPRVGDIHSSLAEITQAKASLNFQAQWTLQSAIPEFIKCL